MFPKLNKVIVKLIFWQNKIIDPNKPQDKINHQKLESNFSHTEVLPTQKNKKKWGIADFLKKWVKQMKKELG